MKRLREWTSFSRTLVSIEGRCESLTLLKSRFLSDMFRLLSVKNCSTSRWQSSRLDIEAMRLRKTKNVKSESYHKTAERVHQNAISRSHFYIFGYFFVFFSTISFTRETKSKALKYKSQPLVSEALLRVPPTIQTDEYDVYAFNKREGKKATKLTPQESKISKFGKKCFFSRIVVASVLRAAI